MTMSILPDNAATLHIPTFHFQEVYVVRLSVNALNLPAIKFLYNVFYIIVLV